MKPSFFTDDLGQINAWTYWRNHYIVGLGSDKAEAESRWREALKVAQG